MPPPSRGSAGAVAASQSGAAALSIIIAGSRSSGSLNLSGRGLKEVPSAVYVLDEELGCDVKWWEMMELCKLDISRNSLKALPEGLCSLGTLTYLDVSCNELCCLPDGLAQLQQLKYLDVSNNPLAVLPEGLAQLPALVSLNSSSCGVSALPAMLGCPALASLNVSGNRLSSLPPSLASCGALVKLDLSSNSLQAMPGQVLAGLTALQELQLSSNLLRGCLTPEVGLLGRLKLLWLRSNNLTELPASIGDCISLIELHLGFNHLSHLPEELAQCRQLKVLDLRNNKISELSDACCTLELNLLDLTNNSIRTINPRLGLMTSLRSLPLDGNPTKIVRRELLAGPISALLEHLCTKLSEQELEVQSHRPYRTSSGAGSAAGLPCSRSGPGGRGAAKAAGHCQGGSGGGAAAAGGREVTWKIGAASSGNVFGMDEHNAAAGAAGKVAAGGICGQEVVLAGRSLRQVPEEVWAAGPHIVKLDLSCNPLGSLPPNALLSFAGLRTLMLKSLGLSSWPLPAVPGALPRLTDLQTSHNPIQALPAAALLACPNLRHLELAGVPGAGKLPTGCLAHAAQLETIDLTQTRTSEIGQELLQLDSLRALNLSGNSISAVPLELTRLTRLEELHLASNSITSLPPQLGLMAPRLRVLTLEGNCLRTIRRPILERGTDALLAYLRDRIPA